MRHLRCITAHSRSAHAQTKLPQSYQIPRWSCRDGKQIPLYLSGLAQWPSGDNRPDKEVQGPALSLDQLQPRYIQVSRQEQVSREGGRDLCF
ncbi:hypothetical protein RRG08_041888 [Elysia crispata]|uniref:Uncharacterized protein n=1 Tax=Elysia crispata TaxID=231223 RepID=A0AAE0Y0K9_9GAST|nr:hypothetical protein RRG08_041888 [Elysia crispata]